MSNHENTLFIPLFSIVPIFCASVMVSRVTISPKCKEVNLSYSEGHKYILDKHKNVSWGRLNVLCTIRTERSQLSNNIYLSRTVVRSTTQLRPAGTGTLPPPHLGQRVRILWLSLSHFKNNCFKHWRNGTNHHIQTAYLYLPYSVKYMYNNSLNVEK